MIRVASGVDSGEGNPFRFQPLGNSTRDDTSYTLPSHFPSLWITGLSRRKMTESDGLPGVKTCDV